MSHLILWLMIMFFILWVALVTTHIIKPYNSKSDARVYSSKGSKEPQRDFQTPELKLHAALLFIWSSYAHHVSDRCKLVVAIMTSMSTSCRPSRRMMANMKGFQWISQRYPSNGLQPTSDGFQWTWRLPRSSILLFRYTRLASILCDKPAGRWRCSSGTIWPELSWTAERSIGGQWTRTQTVPHFKDDVTFVDVWTL